MSTSASHEPWRVVGSFSQRLRLEEDEVDLTSSLTTHFGTEAVPLLLYDAADPQQQQSLSSSSNNGTSRTREVPRYVACKLPRCSLEGGAETLGGLCAASSSEMSVLCATPNAALGRRTAQDDLPRTTESSSVQGVSTVLVQRGVAEKAPRKTTTSKERDMSHEALSGKKRKAHDAHNILLVTTPPNVSQTELIVPALLILADMVVAVTTIAIYREPTWFIVTSCLLIFLPDIVTLVLIFCRNVYCITAALHILLWMTVIMFYVLAQDTVFLLGHTALMIFLVLFTLRLRRSYYQAIFIM